MIYVSSGRYESLLSVERFKKSLTDPHELSSLIEHLMGVPENQLSRLLTGVTLSGYRRVHEHVASTIDRAIEICAARKELNNEAISEFSLLLARGLILINYQVARGQLNRELGMRLSSVITQLLDNVKRAREINEVRKIFESARILIDAIAVIVYRHVRR